MPSCAIWRPGKARYLVLLTLATVLHFHLQGNRLYLHGSSAGSFWQVYLINRVTRAPWKNSAALNSFIIALSIGMLLVGAALGLTIYNRTQFVTDASQTAAPILPGQTPEASTSLIGQLPSVSHSLSSLVSPSLWQPSCLSSVMAGKNLRRERSFDMLILLGTFCTSTIGRFPGQGAGMESVGVSIHLAGLEPVSAVGTGTRADGHRISRVECSLGCVGLLWNKSAGSSMLSCSGAFTSSSTPAYLPTGRAFQPVRSARWGYWLEQQGVHPRRPALVLLPAHPNSSL